MLKDKIVFITGASSGIGAACAKIFAQQGAKLLLCARRIEKLNILANDLKAQYGNNIHCLPLDVRNKTAVLAAIKNLPEDWRNIDILINNAGVALGLDKMQDGNIEDWEQMVDTNIKGLLYITHAILPVMIKRNQGHIINLGSLAGHEVYMGGSVYCATKFAVAALTKGLKLDLLGTPIRISSIDPGAVETELSLVRFKGDKRRAENVYAGMTPLTPDDIADAIYYCASRPPHVNIQEMIILPTDQAAAAAIHRKQIK